MSQEIDLKDIRDRFEVALLSVDRLGVARMAAEVRDAAGQRNLIEHVVAPALDRIGLAWELGEAALSQVYMASRMCEREIDVSVPGKDRIVHEQPRMAIAVLEDHHLLGKRILHSVLVASGHEVLDYDRVDADELVEKVRSDGIEVLLISALMLRSALRVEYVCNALDRHGCRSKVVVGGAPFRFDPSLWKEVGADATAASAFGAIPIITEMLEGRS